MPRGFHQLVRGSGAGQAAHRALPDPQRQSRPGERLEHGGAQAALRIMILGHDHPPAGRRRLQEGGLVAGPGAQYLAAADREGLPGRDRGPARRPGWYAGTRSRECQPSARSARRQRWRRPGRAPWSRGWRPARRGPPGPSGTGVAGVFHVQVVLVGVEVRHPVVGGILPEHGPGSDLRLVQRVGPVLHPDVRAEQRVERACDVADRVDGGVGDAQRRVGPPRRARPGPPPRPARYWGPRRCRRSPRPRRSESRPLAVPRSPSRR